MQLFPHFLGEISGSFCRIVNTFIFYKYLVSVILLMLASTIPCNCTSDIKLFKLYLTGSPLDALAGLPNGLVVGPEVDAELPLRKLIRLNNNILANLLILL